MVILLPLAFIACLCTNSTKLQISVWTIAASLELFALVVINRISWICAWIYTPRRRSFKHCIECVLPFFLLSSFFLFPEPFGSKPERMQGRHLPSRVGRWGTSVGAGYPGGAASLNSWQAQIYTVRHPSDRVPGLLDARDGWPRAEFEGPGIWEVLSRGREPDTGRWILSRGWKAVSWRGGLAYQETEQIDSALEGNRSQASLHQRSRVTNRERIWK